MKKNCVNVLAILVVALLGLVPLSVNASLYSPGLQAGVTLLAADGTGGHTYQQYQAPGDPQAAVQWNIDNLGLLQGGATAYYNQLGGWLSFPAIPYDWPQTNYAPNTLDFSVGGQTRSYSADIIQLIGGSGAGSFSWEATLTGTMSHLLAEESRATLFVCLEGDMDLDWDNPAYYEQSRYLRVDQTDCPSGVCNSTLSAYFTEVPLGVPLNLFFGLLVDAKLLPDAPAFTINMLDTASLLLTEIRDSNNVPLDLSFLQTESGTDYTKLPAGGVVSEPIPEPATLALMGLGLAGLGFARRRRLNA